MRDFSIAVDIEAPPGRVWEVMSDGERWPDWTPSVTSVEIYDKPLRVGSRALIQQPKLPPGRFKVTALEPGRSFTWASGLLGGIMAGRMADLINEYLAMEAAGLKRFSEEGPRGPNTPLADWNAEAVRRLKR